MIIRTSTLFLLILGLSINLAADAEELPLTKELTPLKPFIGKTWRGEFSHSTQENPAVDISRWERTLNGQAVRILHSLNQGEYVGETIVFWDKYKQSLVYYYFTSAGFHTNGTFTFEDNQFTAHEMVTGNSNGITEVRSTGKLISPGKWQNQASYLKDGKWVDGHSATYVEDPNAVVVFR